MALAGEGEGALDCFAVDLDVLDVDIIIVLVLADDREQVAEQAALGLGQIAGELVVGYGVRAADFAGSDSEATVLSRGRGPGPVGALGLVAYELALWVCRNLRPSRWWAR